MLREIRADAAFALHMMRSRPGITVVITMTLAIGIGATTAMFGAVNSAILSRLPFDQPERLVMARATFGGRVNPWVSGYDYFDYRDQSRSFEHLSAFMYGGRVTVLGEAEPELVDSAYGTWDLFHTLRVRPAAGRLFSSEEGVPDGPNVIMVSHAFWQQRWGGGPEAVGDAIVVNGSPHTVIGILPAGFHFLTDADIWRLTYRDGPGATARRWHNLLLVGRLMPNVSLHQAQAEVDTISARLEEQHPDTNDGKALAVTSLHEALVENVRPSLLLLMAAVSLVLLLACGNVAGLLLARAQGRMREIAVRLAMGASRRRLVLQLLTESTVTALISGTVGVAFAFAFEKLLMGLLPIGEFGISGSMIRIPVLLFALGVSLATGVVFGLAPALQGTVVNLAQQLRAGTRATCARADSLLRNCLVILQVAISIMLLIGAGLLIRSLNGQLEVDLGYDLPNVLTAGVRVPGDAYPGTTERLTFFDALVADIQSLPAVESVGLVNRLPIRHRGGNIYLYPEDHIPEDRQTDMSRSADFRIVSPGYFQTIGIPLLAGRDINSSDSEDSSLVMVASKSLAELFFPGENPLGKKLLVDMGELVAHEIVGVVGNARLGRITSDPFHAMYMPYAQNAQSTMHLVVRTQTGPEALVGPIREALKAKDRNIPLAEPSSMRTIADNSMTDFRVVTTSLGLLSGIALLLALVGLYGVLAYYVSQRSHEIGVRIVLGASSRQIANLVLSRGMALVGIGLAIGITAAFWATGFIQRLLFGVEPTDPAAFTVAAVGYGAAALVACLIPAWRATRADPAVTLQAE